MTIEQANVFFFLRNISIAGFRCQKGYLCAGMHKDRSSTEYLKSLFGYLLKYCMIPCDPVGHKDNYILMLKIGSGRK